MMQSEKKEPWKHAPRSAETKKKISASTRGNRNAAKPPELRRVLIAASVAPDTEARLRELSAELGMSRGKLIDAAVARFFSEKRN